MRWLTIVFLFLISISIVSAATIQAEYISVTHASYGNASSSIHVNLLPSYVFREVAPDEGGSNVPSSGSPDIEEPIKPVETLSILGLTLGGFLKRNAMTIIVVGAGLFLIIITGEVIKRRGRKAIGFTDEEKKEKV